MEDLGAPISYLVLETGSPVYASDGERVGRVSEVRADEGADIFDGLVVDRSRLPGGERLVTADHVDEIFERGVLLNLDTEALERLDDSG